MKKYKILMTTMGLDIGGAETHIVELTEKTRSDNARFFDNDINQVPTHAITM